MWEDHQVLHQELPCWAHAFGRSLRDSSHFHPHSRTLHRLHFEKYCIHAQRGPLPQSKLQMKHLESEYFLILNYWIWLPAQMDIHGELAQVLQRYAMKSFVHTQPHSGDRSYVDTLAQNCSNDFSVVNKAFTHAARFSRLKDDSDTLLGSGSV